MVEHHDHHGRTRSAEGAWTRAVEDTAGIKARALELVGAA
jgi:hypothetical protein